MLRRPTRAAILLTACACACRHELPLASKLRLGARDSSTAPSAERVAVPCRSNGSINLDIYQPSRPVKAGPRPPLLIYLPRGPYFHNDEDEASTVAVLRDQLLCSLVRINYRLGIHHRYPQAVHDVLAGYDWIFEHLLPKRAITRAGRPEHAAKVAVCGELFGGSLATALALTECRRAESGILAAAVNNPIVDWPMMHKSGSTAGPTVDASAVDDLTRLRDQLFSKPEHYFDPFASPILFFRSAGVNVPPSPVAPPLDDLAELSLLEREDFRQKENALNGDEAPDASIRPMSEKETPPPQRKASRRFPTPASGLRLPPFHTFAGDHAPLRGQAKELTQVLRQSFARQSRYATPATSGFGRKVLLDGEEDSMDGETSRNRELQKAEAEDKGRLSLHDGLGLWDASAAGQARVSEAARWLKDRLA